MSETAQKVDKVVNNVPTLMTIRQFSEKHPFMSESSIRWLIFKGEIESCLVRLSRRIYLDENKFFEFLKSKKS
jgi:hypothetical protein